MRTWTSLIPAVLLILPFTPALLHAADSDTPLPDRVNQLSKKLETLENDVKANSLRGNRVAEELREIRAELSRIRELLERMAQQQGTIRIQPGYNPSSVAPPGAPVPTMGTITVRNHYTAPATVAINGRTYRVDAGQTLPILGVPAGTFQYSVDVEGYGMVEPLRNATLSPTGYRITIFPRMPY